MDNVQIKDGLGNVFVLRSKDLSAASDGSLQQSMFLSIPYPPDYGGAGEGGLFQHCAKSGTLNAGLAAASSIYSFQWPSTTGLALIQRARFFAWSVTAFTAGLATFDFCVARQFTVNDSGGTGADFTGTNSRLRTSMGAAEAGIMFAQSLGLAVGTRTLDPDPMNSWTLAVPTTPNTLFSAGPVTLFEKLAGEHPLTLADDEGFIIAATVPAGGTWQFRLTLEWAEVPRY